MERGKFITLEGGEGAGKSTQVKLLATFLRGRGFDVVETREVGGCPSAEEIRNLWLGKGEGHWDDMTELLLITAARREHLMKTIGPAMKRGAWVISDRFIDSTRAYQGVAMGLGVELVDHFYQCIAEDFEPDLTLLLDLPVEAGLARVASRGGKDDRYEQKNVKFHHMLRTAYLALARDNAARIRTVDAAEDSATVASAIEALVMHHFQITPS